MERLFRDAPIQQPSLFTYAASIQDKAPSTTESGLEEGSDSNGYYVALDCLLEALENLIQGDYPLSDELRQRLSNHTLEALIFDELKKSLQLMQE